jgi:transposase
LSIVSTGKSNAQKIKHANSLLVVDEVEIVPLTDQEAARRFHCHVNTVANIRERFVEQGFESALERKKRETPPHQPIFDGRAEARTLLCVRRLRKGEVVGRCSCSPTSASS